MGTRSTKEIYAVLEKRLREATQPLTCVDLMDMPDVRAAAIAEYGKDVRVATNKVSDALGLMWRRNLLIKYPSPKDNTLARYAYEWAKVDTPKTVTSVPPSLLSTVKTGVIITEENGGIRIDFDKFTVFVQPK